jgi:PhnB protein
MSRVNTYLNFAGKTEEAFNFYRSVFGTEFAGPIFRMRDMGPAGADLPDEEKNLVGHIELPILGGHVIMGTDMLESRGQQIGVGNNVTLCLEPDAREETDRLYRQLSDGGSESTGMQDMPWAYWGCTLDRYGVRWMFNYYRGDADAG